MFSTLAFRIMPPLGVWASSAICKFSPDNGRVRESLVFRFFVGYAKALAEELVNSLIEYLGADRGLG